MSFGSQGPQTDTYGLSDGLWKNLVKEYVFGNGHRNYGYGLFDDFIGFGESAAVASNVGRYNSNGISYRSWEETSASIAVAAALGGAIALTPTTSDNDCVAIQAGNGTMCPFAVIPGTSGTLVFEARFKIATVTASYANFFIGLGGAGLGAASDALITDTNAFVTNGSFLGFGRLGAATTGLTLYYERNGGTVGSKDDVGTLAADTYIKAGFVFDGTAQTLTPWINGVEVPSERVLAAATGATPWPNAYMNLLAGVKEIATTAGVLTIDWWACGQKLLTLG